MKTQNIKITLPKEDKIKFVVADKEFIAYLESLTPPQVTKRELEQRIIVQKKINKAILRLETKNESKSSDNTK